MATDRHKRLSAQERKNQIMSVAIKLFAHKGFEETKTKEIADAAGISEAAMFKYFKSKQEIITRSLEYKFACHKEENKHMFFDLVDIENQKQKVVLKQIGMKSLEMIEDNIDLVRVILYSILKNPDEMRSYLKAHTREDQRIFKNMTKKGIANNIIKDLDPDIIGPLFPIMMLGLGIANYLIEGKVSTVKQREKLIDTMIEMYLHGILK